MKFSKSAIVIALLVSNLVAFADALPGYKGRSEIRFWINGARLEKLDSVLFLTFSEDGSSIDSLYMGHQWQGVSSNRLWEHEGQVNIDIRSRIQSFKILLIINGKTYSSDNIKYIASRTLYRYVLGDDGKIVGDHHVFYSKWSNYFRALIVTIVLELLIAVAFFKVFRTYIFRFLFSVLIVNLISHPLLWFIDAHVNVGILWLELGVFLMEAIILSFLFQNKLKRKLVIIFALLANLASWLLGYILYLIL